MSQRVSVGNKTKVVQNSYISGIMNDKAWGRTDIQKFYNSVAEADNMLIAITGGAFKRPGFEYLDITDTPNGSKQGEVRLIDFVYNTEQKYLFLIHNETIDLYHVPERDSGFSAVGAPFGSLTGLVELTPKIIKEMSVVQRGDVTLLFHSDIQTRIITRTDYETFTFGTLEMVPPLEDPLDPESEMWSEELGWPSYGCFYQGRLFCAGSENYPLTVWASKSQDYFDFQIAAENYDTPGAPITDTIDSDKINVITGIYAGRNVQVFTSGSEFINGANLITPLDSSWKIQTRFGTQDGTPVTAMDGSTLFIDRHDAIREFVFDYEQDAYTSKDLTTLAGQLFNKPFRMEHVKSARSNLGRYMYVLNEDGAVVALNFDRTESVVAWTTITSVKDRKIIDISTVDNELYMLVLDNNNYYLERLDIDDEPCFLDNYTYFRGSIPVKYCDNPQIPENPLISCSDTVGGILGRDFLLDNIWCEGCLMFVDSSTPPLSEITGLERFNGTEVSYLLDGVYQGEGVVENGELPIDRPFANAHVGYKYNSKLVSLPLASPNFQAELSEKRIIKMRLYMYNTQGFHIDDDFINSNYYDEALYSKKSELYTGMYEHYTLGWDTLKQFTLSSDDPLNFAVLKSEITLDISGG